VTASGIEQRDELPPGLSIVVPCYRSAGTLPELVRRVSETASRVAAAWELILVDDGSPDGTWDAIRELAGRHAEVRGLALMRNYGQHNATLAGVRAARYDVTVTLDDDLQHPPEEMPKLLAPIADGHDLVYGTPERRPQSALRWVPSWLMRQAVTLATGTRTVRELSAYRAFRTGLRRAFADYRSPELLFDALLGWGTADAATVRVRHEPRRVGRSNYGLFRLLNTVMLLWTGYTTAPLRVASLLGFAFVLFGLGVLAYVLGVFFLSEGRIPGFAFLASTIAIFGGVQLFTLGIIGEYLARVFARSLDRPTYVVGRTTEPAPRAGADREAPRAAAKDA